MRSAAEVTSITPGRSADLLDNVDYRLAETPEQKEEIYRLRYRAYLREETIMPSADQRVTDDFDNSPYSWIFGVYIQGELCSSIRVSVATPEHPTSPSVEVFPDILRPELARGRTLVDPTRFVADPERAKRFPELPYATVRLGYVAGVHFNADIGLATVRAEHQAFYRRVFLQEPLCEPRLFPGLLKPVGLMAAHYPTLREQVFARYPYLHSSVFERRMLFDRGGERGLASPDMREFPCECVSAVPRA
jgi:N-acyl-L-homoserine lactone synthetase